MSFADTITITINAVAKVLNRINSGGEYSSEYLLKTAVDEYRLKLRNSAYNDKNRGVKIDRHNIELVHTTFPVAPATLSTVRKYYSILEADATDVSVDVSKFAFGVSAFQTEANFLKMLNWES